MVKFEVTLKNLRKAGACARGYNKVVRGVQGLPFTVDDVYRNTYIRFPHKEPISLLSILESNGLYDALWALRCVEGVDRDARLFAVWCARQVQHLMTDHRSLKALDVAERFANGEVSSEELDAAVAAAWDAAKAAAWDAAWAAAWAATKAAAKAAAWDAAWDAAVAAAGDKQEKMLISMCMGEAPWQ